MKKSRILCTAMLILALLAAPAFADMFYLCKKDGTAKVSAFTSPNLVWGDYPQDLTFPAGDNDGGVCLSSFDCGETSWMFASAYNSADNKQYAYVYPYMLKGWGELNPNDQRIELQDSKMMAPRGALYASDNRFYVIDNGSDSNGTVTAYSIDLKDMGDGKLPLPNFKKLAEITFDSENISLLETGCTAHPEAIFSANTGDEYTIFVLLSVKKSDGTYGKNILVSVKYTDDKLNVEKFMELNTSAFDGLSHKPCIMTVETMPRIFLACDNLVEMVNLSEEWTSTLLYKNGSGEDDWAENNFRFTDIVLDGSSEDSTAYIIAQGYNEKDSDTPYYIREYTVKVAKLIDPEAEERTMSLGSDLKDSEYHNTSAIYDSYMGRIYHFLGNDILLFNKKYTSADLGGAFITAEPCKPYIQQPTGKDYGSDSGGGCNAGCSAAMIFFCAVPFFFRKND